MPHFWPTKKELKTLPTDTGTRLLNGVRTFGGSLVGDAIAGVSPSLASTLQTYTGGLISTTPQSMLEANREGWTNRALNVGEALSSQAVGAMIGPAINKVAPVIKQGIQQIPIHKVNPWAFKPNPEMYYRGIGEAGAQDALASGVFRPKPGGTEGTIVGANGKVWNVGKTFSRTYYSPQFQIANRYGAGFIAEVPKTAAEFRPRYSAGKDWSMLTDEQIPITKGRVLQKDWLRGYKDITPKIPERKIGFEVDTKPVTEITKTTLPNGTELRKNPENYLGGNSPWRQITSPETDGHISLYKYKPSVAQALFQKGTFVNPLRNYYHFNSEMPNKIEAARSFATLMDFVPKGGRILEPYSLSSDSYLNLLKQTKSPQFKTTLNGQIKLNSVGKNHAFKFPNSTDGQGSPIFFKKTDEIGPALEEVNALLKQFNIKKSAQVLDHASETFPEMKIITVPNIQLKKLYKEGGIF